MHSKLTSIGLILHSSIDDEITKNAIVEIRLMLKIISKLALESSYVLDDVSASDMAILLAISSDFQDVSKNLYKEGQNQTSVCRYRGFFIIFTKLFLK